MKDVDLMGIDLMDELVSKQIDIIQVEFDQMLEYTERSGILKDTQYGNKESVLEHIVYVYRWIASGGIDNRNHHASEELISNLSECDTVENVLDMLKMESL